MTLKKRFEALGSVHLGMFTKAESAELYAYDENWWVFSPSYHSYYSKPFELEPLGAKMKLTWDSGDAKNPGVKRMVEIVEAWLTANPRPRGEE